jgi:hypothetical protein
LQSGEKIRAKHIGLILNNPLYCNIQIDNRTAQHGHFMKECDVKNDFIIFNKQSDGYSAKYTEFFKLENATPSSQFVLIPYLSETFAQHLMNSLSFKKDWKQDFSRDPSTEHWDLINSEGITIEVKSTTQENTFRIPSVSTSLKKQRESLVMKLFMEKSGINRMKFVRFSINEEDEGKPIEECSGKWINVTANTLTTSNELRHEKGVSPDPNLEFSHLTKGCLECGSPNGEFFEEEINEMSEGQMAEYMAGTYGEWTCFDCGVSAFREA